MTFPIGQDEFIRWQEHLSQRTFDPSERDLLLAWLDVFNDIYMCGRENDASTFYWWTARIKQRRQDDSPAARQFLEAALYLTEKAWEHGYIDRLQEGKAAG